ncbi:MAG UNVERIFIED_CONTAM: type IV conjugative transfer system protein TraE [Rickettsiaceae bacterium]|jgi:type IV conjugative transfer system protein TraE
MQKRILFQNIDRVARQRDLFLFASIIILISNMLLVIKIVSNDEKFVMVPGLNQSVWISNNSISSSYLEEMSLIFLNNLLDINPDNIEYKKSIILKHISTSNQETIFSIKKYFAELEEKYKKFGLSTYFTIKNMEIDTSKLKVIVSGILTSSYGKRGNDVKEEIYQIDFDYNSHQLKLKSFSRISK